MGFFSTLKAWLGAAPSTERAIATIPVVEGTDGGPTHLKGTASQELRTADTTLAGCTVPASSTGAITASDTTTYSPPLRALWATGAGNITVVLSGSTSSIVIPVAANEKITFLQVSKVLATGTTATGISGAA